MWWILCFCLRISFFGSQVILQLLVIGVSDPESFDFISPPPSLSIKGSMELLFDLKCIQYRTDPAKKDVSVVIKHD